MKKVIYCGLRHSPRWNWRDSFGLWRGVILWERYDDSGFHFDPVLRLVSSSLRMGSKGYAETSHPCYNTTPRHNSKELHRKVIYNLSPSALDWAINPSTPNDPYRGRTAPLTSKCCILYIYSTNTGTEYFKRDIYSPIFFSLSLFKMQFVS